MAVVPLQLASAQGPESGLEACMAEEILTAPDSVSVGEIREYCRLQETARVGEPEQIPVLVEEGTPVVTRRLEQERSVEGRPWTLLPHRPNFIIPYSYNTSFDSRFYPDLYAEIGEGESAKFKEYEAIFQLSMKVPIWYGMLRGNGDAYFAFTARSWWQVYASDVSAPFRETNYEPEFFVRFENDWEILGFRNTLNTIGLSHQSNGRDEPLSRSWNRLFASFLFEKGNVSFRVKPWYRFPEDEEDDDNPNIERWLGYADYSVAWAPGDHRFFTNVRNNLKGGGENRGSVELTYSYPVWGGLRLYCQWFSGYGDGLIYYNEYTNRIGVGISLGDVI
ncbi:MAG: phospholipase A [Gammaproteobacteria bacterium]